MASGSRHFGFLILLGVSVTIKSFYLFDVCQQLSVPADIKPICYQLLNAQLEQLEAKSVDFLGDYMQACISNFWSKETNPNGYLNFGTSENYLCEDLLVEKFNSPGFYEFTPEMMHYYAFHGTLKLRTSVAKFMDRYFRSSIPINADDLIMILGCCDGLDTVAHAVAEPGDVFLCPSPYYTRIHRDMYERSLVQTYDVPLNSTLEPGETKPFQLTLNRVERAYKKAVSENYVVRGIVLMNPNNPLGSIHTYEELLPILEFAKSQKLWVIMDEIYALNITDQSARFDSVLSWYEKLPDPQRTVWEWGLSKDFGAPGLRVSFVHTPNEHLKQVFVTLSMLQTVPLMLHSMTEKLLTDYEWLDTVFFPTVLVRMRDNYEMVRQTFADLNVEALPVQGGLFVYANFSKFLKEKTFEAEHELFEKIFKETRVYFVPGRQLYCTEPGWYRIVFTVSSDTLKEGLSRLSAFLKNLQK